MGIPMRNEGGLVAYSKSTEQRRGNTSFVNINGILMKKKNKSRRPSQVSDMIKSEFHKSISDEKNIKSADSSIKELLMNDKSGHNHKMRQAINFNLKVRSKEHSSSSTENNFKSQKIKTPPSKSVSASTSSLKTESECS